MVSEPSRVRASAKWYIAALRSGEIGVERNTETDRLLVMSDEDLERELVGNLEAMERREFPEHGG